MYRQRYRETRDNIYKIKASPKLGELGPGGESVDVSPPEISIIQSMYLEFLT